MNSKRVRNKDNEMESESGFEPLVFRICSPVHWAALPLTLTKERVGKDGFEPPCP